MATAAKSRATKSAAVKATEAMETAAETMQTMMGSPFSYPQFEVPEVVRSFAEEGLKQTREAYARAKNAAEEATDLLEDSLVTGRNGIREAQYKALDAAKANTDATFVLMRQLLTANTVNDAMQIQAAYARERFEAFMDYSKDVQELMSRAGADAAKPAQAMIEKSFAATKAA